MRDKDFITFFIENFNLKDLDITERNLLEIWNENKQEIILKSIRIKINSVTLVKNQEAHISQSIESSKIIADKIFIFDTGSTDGTVKVIEKEQKVDKRIFLNYISWTENFAEARNKADDLVPEGWVFLIDSDEKLVSELPADFLKISLAFIEFLYPKYDLAIGFKQTGGESLVTNWVDRLYKKSNTLNFFGHVHEELRFTNQLKKIRTQFTLENYGRTDEQKEKFDKARRYYNLLLRNIKEEPDNIKWVALLPFEEAIKKKQWYLERLEFFAKKILYKSESLPCAEMYETSFFQETVLVDYIRLLLLLGQLEVAEELIYLSRKRFPTNTSLLFLYYYIKNNAIVMNATKLVSDLKNDIRELKNDNKFQQKWKHYASIFGFEELLVKLLLKSEKYNVAISLLDSLDLNNNEKTLISEEKRYFSDK